jgi:hypothetical protein
MSTAGSISSGDGNISVEDICPMSIQRVASTASHDSGTSSQRRSTKRPLMTHTKDGQALSEKKLRRLEKNRQSARDCRRRKREAAENIQRQINILEAENLQLRLQMQIGQEAEANILQEQAELTRDIDRLLKSGASEADVYRSLEEYKERYADYGTSRRSAIEFHLRNVERLLMPTQTTSVVLKAIQMGTHNLDANTTHATAEAAATESAAKLETDMSPTGESADAVAPTIEPRSDLDPKALFQHLVQYLKVTPAQSAALKDSRMVAKELDDCLAQALGVLHELQSRLARTGQDLEAEFADLRKTLTPTQAAKFLVWVANNKACVYMLNELWEKVYPIENNNNIAVSNNDIVESDEDEDDGYEHDS